MFNNIALKGVAWFLTNPSGHALKCGRMTGLCQEFRPGGWCYSGWKGYCL